MALSPTHQSPCIVRQYHANAARGYALRVLATTATLVSGLTYFIWRFTVFNPEAPFFSLAFYLAEGFGFVSLLLSTFTFWKTRSRIVKPPPDGLSVDVFIPTLDEPIHVIRLTAVAARDMDYPHKTWILDDGNREEIKGLASELGCEYLARTDNSNAKAGNLNHALSKTSGDYILLLDADHVPQPWMLSHLLGYFDDEKLALVQSPQDYYTTDTLQFRNRSNKLWHDQSLFYKVGQSGRDTWNATSFCGTNAVVRRSALEKIGGFAYETVTEDMHTSVRLQKIGYKTAYHPESLAFGISATDYVEFLQQRLRWGHGNVQVLREEGLPFCQGLSWPQKLSYTLLGISYFEGWTRLALYLTPAVVLFTGIAPLGYTQWFLWFFLPYFVSAVCLINVMGRGDSNLLQNERLAMARFPIYILATFGLFIRRKYWRITSKLRGKIIPSYFILPQTTILAMNVTAIIVALVSPPLRLIESLSGGTLIIIMFWAVYVSWLSAMAIIDVMIDSGKRHYHSFKITLPADLVWKDGIASRCETHVFADHHIVISNPEELDSRNIVAIRLYLPSKVLQLPVISKTPAGDGKLALSFNMKGMDAGHYDAYRKAIHACTWHRILEYPDTYPIVDGRQPRWKASVFHHKGGKGLCFSGYRNSSGNLYFIVFSGDTDGIRSLSVEDNSHSRVYMINQESRKIIWPGAALFTGSEKV